MFRAGQAPLLGRWSSRDFLRGRTKKGGAIHTRHTHGSKGRYKRLSTLYGLRDGRRHASNHMQGGLGIKLGGGLFGLRIPRQHMLSTMTREEYELQMYGHPNITNPYREHMEEHPDLRAVMENATLDCHVAVLLPRAPRFLRRESPSLLDTQHSAEPAQVEGAEKKMSALPQQWVYTAKALADAFQCFNHLHINGAEVKLDLATLDVSTTCNSNEREGVGDNFFNESSLLQALESLYSAHGQGRRLQAGGEEAREKRIRLAKARRPPRDSGRQIPFMGKALLSAAAQTHEQRQQQRSHDNLVRLLRSRGDGTAATTTSSPEDHDDKVVTRGAVNGPRPVGIQDLLRNMRKADPNALCICVRPVTSAEELQEESKTTQADGISERKHPLLKSQVDKDEDCGVWQQPRSTVQELMRWHYSNNDPRAHSSDILPHRMRRMSVVLLVDCSKLAITPAHTAGSEQKANNRDKEADRKEPAGTGAVHNNRAGMRSLVPSLMSRGLSEELIELGFRASQPTRLSRVFDDLSRWSADTQWSVYAQHCDRLKEVHPRISQVS